MASPSDLIRDSRTTPFNIGRRIALTDFTQEEAAPLTLGLRCDPSAAAKVLGRVLHWTGGHPYLTQRLCRAAAEAQATTDAAVDGLCEELFLSTRARASDDNLMFAREQMLRGEVDRASLLTLYCRIWERKRVPDDPGNQLISVLRLSGVIRAGSGHLTVSNRIYGHVFDRRWVETNMPDQERRRQRAAYRRGLLKAGGIAAVILGAVCAMAVWAILEQHAAVEALKLVDKQKQAVEAKNIEVEAKNKEVERQKKEVEEKNKEVEAEKAIADARRKDAEAAQEQFKKEKDRSAQLKRVSDEAVATAGSSTHDARLQLARSYVARGDALAAAGRYGDAKASYDDAVLAFTQAGESPFEADLGLSSLYVRSPPPLLSLPAQESAVMCAALSPDGRLALSGSAGGSITLWDLPSGTERFAFEGHTGPVLTVAFSPDGRTAVSGSGDGTVRTWDTATGAALRTILIRAQRPPRLSRRPPHPP